MSHFRGVQNIGAGRHVGEYLSYPVILKVYRILKISGAHAMHTYYWAPTLKGYNSVGLGWCLEIQISNLSGSDAGGYIDGTWRDPGISVSTVDKT